MKKGVGCHSHRWRGQTTQVRALTFQTNERSWLRLWLLFIGLYFIWCFLIPFLFIIFR